MVEKGLKKGAAFVDGKYTYKVVAVNKDGTYVSKRAETETKPEKK